MKIILKINFEDLVKSLDIKDSVYKYETFMRVLSLLSPELDLMASSCKVMAVLDDLGYKCLYKEDDRGRIMAKAEGDCLTLFIQPIRPLK